jgi:superfamily II DNA or RNA helicase
MVELIITVYSHNFAISKISARARPAIDAFAKKQVQYGFERRGRHYVHAALRVYGASTSDRTECRFHINQLEEFKKHLATYGLKEEMYAVEVVAIPEATKAELVMRPHWEMREEQLPVVAYLDEENENRSKFVSAQTGAGKGLMSMKSLSNTGERVLVVVKPMYIEKWVKELQEVYDIAPEDIMVVQGGAHLMKLLELANDKEAFTAKVIIISNKTMQNWFKLYEQHNTYSLELGYACLPIQLCEHLGVGVRVIDEVHQDFHFNFKLDLYTHVKKSISLSATLVSDNDFMNKVYEIAYPAFLRYKAPAYKRYVDIQALLYELHHPEKVRYQDPSSKSYSHHVFEQSVIRSKPLLDGYLKMIGTILRGSYMKDYKKGQRCIVFCASIDMCTLVTNYLKGIFPEHDVRRYVEDDDFSDLMTADISVSTILSAGTAVDISNLTTALLTTNVASQQANLQSLGRLRVLKCGTTPQFMYLICTDIPKHIDYHKQKKQLLENRALSFRTVYTRIKI